MISATTQALLSCNDGESPFLSLVYFHDVCHITHYSLTKLEVGIAGADVVERAHESLENQSNTCKKTPQSMWPLMSRAML